jgi:hypothetical protein
MQIKYFMLPILGILLASCARRDFVRAPDPFKALPADSSVELRQAYFEKQKVHVLGPNHGMVGGQDYNSTELLRYYDDSRSGDASALETEAQMKVPASENAAFYPAAFGFIGGALWGGIHAYLGTANTDFSALSAIPGGAVIGLGWGGLAGSVLGGLAFLWQRHQALELNQEAAGEFNHLARTELKLNLNPLPGGAKGTIQWEY